MKYICLGYLEPGKFKGMTEDERNAVFDACFEHNDHLRANGHLAGEMALQPLGTAVTLYWKNGRVARAFDLAGITNAVDALFLRVRLC